MTVQHKYKNNQINSRYVMSPSKQLPRPHLQPKYPYSSFDLWKCSVSFEMGDGKILHIFVALQ